MFNLQVYRMKETRVFRDVIHGYIKVEYVPIWQLINTPEFQRLRRIKQLGGISHVFPCADHSRFVHSLGVYEIVRQMTHLEEIKRHLNDYETLCVLVAGLLHDIGHGPYSHCFETIMHCPHEKMGTAIILGDTHIHDILAAIDPKMPEDVAAIIEKKHPKPMLSQMIASQLDADRMDYLLRDSYFAGVTYGQFDKERILRTLRVRDEQIVFKESGIQAIEDYMLARYYMYYQVYYHPIGRSHDHLLQSIFKRLDILIRQDYPFVCDMSLWRPLFSGHLDIKTYLHYDESALLALVSSLIKEEDELLKDLCDRFMNRRLLKFATLKSHDQIQHIQSLCVKQDFDPDYYVAYDGAVQALYENDPLGNKANEIAILEEDGTITGLLEKSEIVKAILGSKPKQDQKIFYPKEVKAFL